MATRSPADPPLGPYRADQIRSGDPYEISDGYRIECMTTGGRGGRSTGEGFMTLDTDPAAPPAGVDVGVSPVPSMLRAPDISVGNVDDKPGWATIVPPLAVEYADTGQDEPELQKKILELLRFGTRFIWVVRLTGPRRVEVYTPGAATRIVGPGGHLEAPGILKNAVPVEALYDRDAAHRHTLKNLLQRQGYEDLEAVKTESWLDAQRAAVRGVLARRKLALTPALEARIDACTDRATLERWRDAAIDAASAAAALD